MKKITLLVAVLATTLSFGQELASSGNFSGLGDGPLASTATTGWYSPNSTSSISSEKGVLPANTDKATQLCYKFTTPVSATDQVYVVSSTITPQEVGVNKAVTYSVRKSGTYQELSLGDENEVGALGKSCKNCDPVSADNHIFKVAFEDIQDVTQSKLTQFEFTASSETEYVFFVNLPKLALKGIFVDDLSVANKATLSDESNAVSGLSVYPNPASEVVYVSAAEAIESVFLVNALGQTVAAPFNGTSVDVAALPNGVYILTVVAGGKSSAQKVLVD